MFRELKWKLPKRVFRKVFSELRYDVFPKFHVLAQIGSVCKKALFILEGEIWVLRHKPREGLPRESEEIRDKRGRRLKDEDEIFRSFPDFELAEIIRKGYVFGEKYLEKEDFM